MCDISPFEFRLSRMKKIAVFFSVQKKNKNVWNKNEEKVKKKIKNLSVKKNFVSLLLA